MHAATLQEFEILCERLVGDSSTEDNVDVVSLEGGNVVNDQIGYVLLDEGTVFFGDAQAKKLGQCLKDNATITEFYVPISRLTVRGAACLMGFIINCQSLQILSLQGSFDTFEYPNQTMVVDVFVRAAVQNINGICLELNHCPVARSSLFVAFGGYDNNTWIVDPNTKDNCISSSHNESHLSELCLVNDTMLIIDDNLKFSDKITRDGNNQTIHLRKTPSCTFCNSIQSLSFGSIVLEDRMIDEYDSDDEEIEDLSNMDWMIRCASYFPCLGHLSITHNFDIKSRLPWEFLVSSTKLKAVTYRMYGMIDGEIQPFLCFLEQSMVVENISIYHGSRANITFVLASILDLFQNHETSSRSITSVSPSGGELGFDDNNAYEHTIRQLNQSCQWNKTFLKNWEDKSIEIPTNLFPLAAAKALKSQRGISTLFHQRLPFILSSSLSRDTRNAEGEDGNTSTKIKP